MGQEPALTPPPRVYAGGRAVETADPRVRAVLEVLAGQPVPEVARSWAVDVALLHRWVRDFVAAGTAQVTNRPDPQAANQRDRFLAAFAHELRSPLSVAQGWVGMLVDGAVPPGSTDATVIQVHEALGRLRERTLDVELLAAASMGRLELRRDRVRVGDLVEPLSELTEVGGEGAEVELVADPRLLGRAVRDLWNSACIGPEHQSRGLEVLIVEPWVELRVLRRGDPIDPRVLQALFEPFDLNDDGTGVTIGLYLARALTVAHGGTIGVDQDDSGTVLWMRIPRRPVTTEIGGGGATDEETDDDVQAGLW